MSDQDLKERILNAAEACLLETGASGRIHGRIAERAGVSRPTVYKYVGDQQAVVDALLLREANRCLAAVQPILSRPGLLRERLIDGVTFIVTYIRDHALFQGLMREYPDIVLPWLTTHAEPMLRRGLPAMAGHVQQGAMPGRALRTDPAVIAEWGVRLAISLITTPSITRPLDTPEDLRRYLGALFDVGLCR